MWKIVSLFWFCNGKVNFKWKFFFKIWALIVFHDLQLLLLFLLLLNLFDLIEPMVLLFVFCLILFLLRDSIIFKFYTKLWFLKLSFKTFNYFLRYMNVKRAQFNFLVLCFWELDILQFFSLIFLNQHIINASFFHKLYSLVYDP